MKEMQKKELQKVYGGFSIWSFISIIAALVFGMGAVDGYARPESC